MIWVAPGNYLVDILSKTGHQPLYALFILLYCEGLPEFSGIVLSLGYTSGRTLAMDGRSYSLNK